MTRRGARPPGPDDRRRRHGPIHDTLASLKRVPRAVIASWQAELVADNDPYWPNGFFAKLVALFKEGSDAESRSADLAEMRSRAAEELTTDKVAQPRRAVDEEAALKAAF